MAQDTGFGAPALHKTSPKFVNAALAQQIWDYSEDITGVRYPTGVPA